MAVGRALARQLRRLAGGCCEYCQLAEDDLSGRFEIDHITPVKHGGDDSLENLSLACTKCNRFKGPNLAGRDPQSDQIAALYNPRKQNWADHFVLADDGSLLGRTPEGRATVEVLRMNTEARRAKRRKLKTIGRYPCQKP